MFLIELKTTGMIETFAPFGIITYRSVEFSALALFIANSRILEFSNSYSEVGDAPSVIFPKSRILTAETALMSAMMLFNIFIIDLILYRPIESFSISFIYCSIREIT